MKRCSEYKILVKYWILRRKTFFFFCPETIKKLLDEINYFFTRFNFCCFISFLTHTKSLHHLIPVSLHIALVLFTINLILFISIYLSIWFGLFQSINLSVCRPSARGGFGGFGKKSELRTRLRTGRVHFRGSLRPDEFVRYGRRTWWKSHHRKIVHLSSLCRNL